MEANPTPCKPRGRRGQLAKAGLAAPLVAVLLASFPAVSRAQVEFTTRAGPTIPTGDLLEMISIREGPVSLTEVSVDTATITLRPQSGFTAGIGVTWWASRTLGLGADVTHASLTIERRRKNTLAPGVFRDELESTLFTAMARTLIRFDLTDATDGRLLAGLGLLKRGGDAWEGFDGTTGFAWSIGAGIGVGLGAGVSFRLDVLDRMTSSDLHLRGFDGEEVHDDFVPPTRIRQSTMNHFEHELVIVPGLAIRLGGGG